MTFKNSLTELSTFTFVYCTFLVLPCNTEAHFLRRNLIPANQQQGYLSAANNLGGHVASLASAMVDGWMSTSQLRG